MPVRNGKYHEAGHVPIWTKPYADRFYDETSDRVICPECGWRGKLLATHLRRSHEIRWADFKQAHGIPIDTSIICRESHEKFAQNAKWQYDTFQGNGLHPREKGIPGKRWSHRQLDREAYYEARRAQGLSIGPAAMHEAHRRKLRDDPVYLSKFHQQGQRARQAFTKKWNEDIPWRESMIEGYRVRAKKNLYPRPADAPRDAHGRYAK